MFKKLWLNFSILFALRPLWTSWGVFFLLFFGIIAAANLLAENDTQKGVAVVVGFLVAMAFAFISYRRASNFKKNVPDIGKRK